MNVLVTGSTGLVGRALTAHLKQRGHTVSPLLRPRDWSPETEALDQARLEGIEAVVHLAGENVASGRWSKDKKSAILESRVRGTRFLSQTLARLKRPPRVLVSASAIGFYGDRGDELLTEDSAPGNGFLAEVCRAWESATEPASSWGPAISRTCGSSPGIRKCRPGRTRMSLKPCGCRGTT